MVGVMAGMAGTAHSSKNTLSAYINRTIRKQIRHPLDPRSEIDAALPQAITLIASAISAMPLAACNARRVHGATNQRRMTSSAVAHVEWHNNASDTCVAAR